MCKHLVIHFVIKVYARNSVFKEVICTICSYAHHKSKYEGAYIHLYNCHVSVSKWWTLEQLDFSSILLPSWKVLPYSWQLVTTRKSVFFFFLNKFYNSVWLLSGVIIKVKFYIHTYIHTNTKKTLKAK